MLVVPLGKTSSDHCAIKSTTRERKNRKSSRLQFNTEGDNRQQTNNKHTKLISSLDGKGCQIRYIYSNYSESVNTWLFAKQDEYMGEV